MSTAAISSLSYPIGKFEWTGNLTESQRSALIHDIAELPRQLRAAVANLNDSQLETPYRPGGWTVRQTVHHLADGHMNAYIRFKLALTEPEPLVKTFEETEWAELPDSKLPIEVSLRLIESLHERWSVVLQNMQPVDFSRTLRHPQLGVVDLDRYLALYAWHGKHHVAHISGLRTREGW